MLLKLASAVLLTFFIAGKTRAEGPAQSIFEMEEGRYGSADRNFCGIFLHYPYASPGQLTLEWLDNPFNAPPEKCSITGRVDNYIPDPKSSARALSSVNLWSYRLTRYSRKTFALEYLDAAGQLTKTVLFSFSN